MSNKQEILIDRTANGYLITVDKYTSGETRHVALEPSGVVEIVERILLRNNEKEQVALAEVVSISGDSHDPRD